MRLKKRRAVWRLAGDLRGEGANILLRLWQAIGWDEAVSAQAGVITRYGVRCIYEASSRGLMVVF